MSRATRLNSRVGAADADTRYTRQYVQTIDDLVAQIPTKGLVVMAHRGAGDALAPENTRAAFRMGAAYSGNICQDGGDLYDLVGEANDLAVHHNNTVDFATSSTGYVADYTTAAWRTLTIDPATGGWFSGAATNEQAIMFSDLLREFGGKRVLWPEAKTTRAATILAQMAKASGLGRSLVLQSFFIADVQTMAAANTGCALCLLSGVDGEYTPAQALAAGADWVSLNGYSNANIQAFIAAGLKVQVWTYGRHIDFDKYTALGVHSVASWNPVYFSRNYPAYRMTRDGFVGGAFMHGFFQDWSGNQSLTAADRGTFEAGGWYTFPKLTTPTTKYMNLGQLSPLASPTNFTIDIDVRFRALSSDTSRFFGLATNSTDDIYTGQVAIHGYEFLLRHTGSLEIYQRNGASSAAGYGTKATGVVTAGTIAHLQIKRNGNTLSVARTDAGSTDTTPLTTTNATAAAAAFNTPDVYLKGGISDSSGLMDVSIRNIAVT